MKKESDKKQPEIVADWHIELNAECPSCGVNVNLLEAQDFWDGRMLEICENHTEASNNLEVHCPKCYQEFKVCCRW